MWNNTTPVAVKRIQSRRISVNDFLRCANLMKKLQHPNLVQLYAICSKEEPVYIITELMKYGSLLEYFKGEGKLLNPTQLITIASQVAAAMAYLEGQNIIHRDLAAQNIQVGEHLIYKLANLELVRTMDKDVYVAKKEENFPIKWTAPEAILHFKFSIKSDV